MQSASGNQLVENLFTNGRHLNLLVVFVSQNLFYTGKKCRTISLNSTYIIVFKNPKQYVCGTATMKLNSHTETIKELSEFRSSTSTYLGRLFKSFTAIFRNYRSANT